MPQKSQNSLLNSLIAGKSHGDGCDMHCAASQAFTASEKLAVRMAERRTIGGLLRFDSPSPDSRVYRIRGQFTESLRPLPRILPFSGDFHWRRGSITTGCGPRESISFASRAVNALDRETHPRTARRWPQSNSPPSLALGRVLINLRRRPVRPDTDRLCATAANVAMGQKATLC
jgi:hypothetical protein